MMRQVIIALLLGVAAIYLFVTAPPPLPETARAQAPQTSDLPVKVLLDAANLVNAAARKIYTERIVTPGQQVGLVFGEDWQEAHSKTGPLPALFLRKVAAELQAQGAPLALFLGSDQPISPSNAFKGEQVRHFAALKEDRKPRYFDMPALRLQVALYPDIAAAPGCVSCHNEHPNSPKTDWRLGDVMGATTWTHPRAAVSDRELRQGIAQVYAAVERAYAAYLEKVRRIPDPPSIGSAWPGREGRRLPDAETFMSAVKEATAAQILDAAVLLR
ncbi:c-type heme family protein [Microvirga lenta]|uniref:c-type heme family protein n=1 Tax=Microvirga lenta TaxID=2881337 RepID=UPI001D00072C|nr:DUF3365 domain-containing protein [Microvirga lenta]MCB5177497.1 DUF3365 domain-containing protein [Microvirga lenta]